MQIVIDIPEEKWEVIQNKMYCNIFDLNMWNAIKNGTPLEKIRAEIKHYNLRPSNYPCDMISIGTVLQIIDKYRESEGEK